MTNKHSTPILDAVLAQRAEDARNGVDPYNTGTHRALVIGRRNTTAQQQEAQQVLACFATKLELAP